MIMSHNGNAYCVISVKLMPFGESWRVCEEKVETHPCDAITFMVKITVSS